MNVIPSQFSGNTLTGGTWDVLAGATLSVPSAAAITTNDGNVTLSGAGSVFTPINSLATNNGSFSVLAGRSFSTFASLSNTGTLTIGGTLDVAGSYSQTSAAILDDQISGTQAAQFGQMAVTGTATLAGALGVGLINAYQPAQGTSASFLTANLVTGAFSSVVNTVPGSGYAFSANYSAPDVVSIVVTTIPFVALVVTQEQGPSQLAAGLPGTVTWTVTNQGNTATTATWNDAVYLSADGQIDTNSILLATQPEGPAALAANGSYQASATFSISPGQSPEAYSLLVDADYDQGQSESTLAGNVRAVSVQVLPPQPDLLVTGLSVSPASGLESGGNLTVNWSDANEGLGPDPSSFTDQVQIVNTTDGQTLATGTARYNATTQGPLAAGGSVAQQYTFQLPNGAAGAGSLMITVTNDIYDQVTKFNANGTPETSSTATATTPSALAPYPDLHVAGLAVDPSSVVQSGGTVTLDWNDSNVGTGTASGSWYDSISVVNTTTGQTLANTSQSYSAQSIAAGTSTARSFSFTLPNGAAGVGGLSITVIADAGTSLLDYNSSGVIDTNRSSSITASTTLANYPDLHVTALAVDPSSVLQSGGTVTLDWNDSNVGTGAAIGVWYDSISVVNTTTGQTLTSTSQSYSAQNLAADTSAARSFSFTLPNGAPGVGNLSITVTADAGSNLLDYNASGVLDTNRSANITAQSTLAPYPNLVVGSVSAPGTAVVGQSIPVSWTDVNQGNATASGSWVDRIYLYQSPTDISPLLLASVPFTGTIAAGKSASLSSTVYLPTDDTGSFYLGVTTDFFDQVVEASTTRQNTTILTQPTQIASPELVAQSVQTSTSATQFGQTVSVTWTVANNGNATATGSWTDELYLSNQPTLGANPVALLQAVGGR